jgi:phenylalanyl-tRNA synthetase alpha subunit
LKAQKECEDESTKIAFGNLCSEVITLQNEAHEKDKFLLSLVERLKTNANLAKFSEADQKISKLEKEKEADAKHIDDLEYALSTQVELHKSEVTRLEKKLGKVTENFNVEQAKREIFDNEQSRVQKNVEQLREVKEECYFVAMQCSDKLKNAFAKVGAFSTE